MFCSAVSTDLTHGAAGFNVGLSSLPDLSAVDCAPSWRGPSNIWSIWEPLR